MRIKQISIGIIILICSSCIPGGSISESVDPPESPAVTPTPTSTAEPTATIITKTEAPMAQFQVCSPLEGETLDELPEIITQSFKPPRGGQDVEKERGDHHGVDFSFYRRKELMSIDGLPIQSVLEGQVATVILDKYPYGNAVIIETPLDIMDTSILNQLNFPEMQPTVAPDPKFNWTDEGLPFQLSEISRSIYLYYAHLKHPAEVNVGDFVTCGQRIGQVGSTGDSSNSHLHFEIRIGPSGARFESMAYYTAQSTATERYNYIVWRVTNLFQLLDPMQLLSLKDYKD